MTNERSERPSYFDDFDSEHFGESIATIGQKISERDSHVGVIDATQTIDQQNCEYAELELRFTVSVPVNDAELLDIIRYTED